MKQVEDARKACGLKQSELAKAAGISQPTISHITTGKKSPTVRTLEKLAAAMNCTLVIEFRPNEDLEKAI